MMGWFQMIELALLAFLIGFLVGLLAMAKVAHDEIQGIPYEVERRRRALEAKR